MSQIHSAEIVIEGLEAPTLTPLHADVWTRHIDKAEREVACWGLSCETLLQEILDWSHLYQDAAVNLSQELVISHRDLDSKNVIWHNESTPYLIDWESAGYVHPTVYCRIEVQSFAA